MNKYCSLQQHRRPIRPGCQAGVGLIEVMIALFVLAFGALAIANLQTSALVATHHSSSHFALNSIGSEILEHLKADAAEAAAGSYNTDYAQLAVDASAPRAAEINRWKSRVASALGAGATRINCSATNCAVSLRWDEQIGSGSGQQFYNVNVPLGGT